MAMDFTVSIPATLSNRKAWFSAPRLNFSSMRRRRVGVMVSKMAAKIGTAEATITVRTGL
jgi:hypothetical protein